MKELISNVFAIECFPVIFHHCQNVKQDKTSYKWKNIMKSYPVFVKNYKVPKDILPLSFPCVTLAGMYFFYFLTFTKKHLTSLQEFLKSEQGINTIKEYILYRDEETSAIFTGIINLSGKMSNIVSNSTFNESLEYLIESYAIIPIPAENGIIWVLNKKRDDLCHLETILRKYSPFTR